MKYTTFSDAVKKKDISILELSNKIEKNKKKARSIASSLYQWHNKNTPSMETQIKIAKYLGIPLEEAVIVEKKKK